MLGSSDLFSLELMHSCRLDKEQRTRENLRAVSHNAWRVERNPKRDIIFQPAILESSHHFLYAESFPHSALSLAVVDQDPAGPGCPSAGLSLCHLCLPAHRCLPLKDHRERMPVVKASYDLPSLLMPRSVLVVPVPATIVSHSVL